MIDLTFAAAGLIALAPFLALIAVAIRLDSHGSAVYRQARRGRYGRTFRIAKFRTMHEDAERRRSDVEHLNGADWPLFKVKGRDPRITRVGWFLRRWSLDELPQLWNVLKGEMSLVGPRPLVLREADSLGTVAPSRLDVAPGITGLWQTRGRHELPVDEMLRLDSEYVGSWSVLSDLAILVQTIGTVAMRRGAY